MFLKSSVWIICMTNILPISTLGIDDVNKKHGRTKDESVSARVRFVENRTRVFAPALTLALFSAPQVRLELTTHGLTVRCSNQLSY